MNHGVSETLYHVTVDGNPSGRWLSMFDALLLEGLLKEQDPDVEVLIEEEK